VKLHLQEAAVILAKPSGASVVSLSFPFAHRAF